MFLCIVVIGLRVATSQVYQCAYGSTLRQRLIYDPCGGTTRHVRRARSMTNYIGITALEARDLAEGLQNDYTNRFAGNQIRISRIMENFLSSRFLDTFPTVGQDENNLNTTLRNVLKIEVFVSKSMAQEWDQLYRHKMLRLRNVLRQFTCEIKSRLNTNIEWPICVTIRECSCTSLAERYERDYLIFRDAKEYLREIAERLT